MYGVSQALFEKIRIKNQPIPDSSHDCCRFIRSDMTEASDNKYPDFCNQQEKKEPENAVRQRSPAL